MDRFSARCRPRIGQRGEPIVSGVALLTVAYALRQRQRERVLMERLKRAGDNPSAVLGEMDLVMRDEKAREAFWRKQNPR